MADRRAMRRTQAKLERLAPNMILPGHGPVIEGEDALRRVRSLPRYLP